MICPHYNKEINEDFIEVKLGKLTFRIYKWSKPIKDFVIPKGYRMAEFQEFVDLYDSGFNMEKYPAEYFVKHYSKKQKKKEYCLSRLCLYWDLYLGSYVSDLADSNGDGRVVCVKEMKK